MANEDRDISTRLVVILLIPVVLVLFLLGYVIADSLTVSQLPGDPDVTVVIEDHPDQLNRSGAGEGVVKATLRGDEPLNWSSLAVDIVDPRSEAVTASFVAPEWSARERGQTIELHTNGTVPRPDETLRPGESFVLRDVRDDGDASADLVNPCGSYVFRVRHLPSESILGTYEVRFVTDDWVPGTSCDDTGG